MAKVYQVRGHYPGIGNSPVGFRGAKVRKRKIKRAKPLLTIAGLDELYLSFKPASAASVSYFWKRVRETRLAGQELGEALLRKRYPLLFRGVSDARIRAELEAVEAPPPAPLAPQPEPSPQAVCVVPLPTERLAPEVPAAGRPGQTAFRAAIIDLYQGRCAVTGCAISTVLDAAHIIPFVDERSHVLANGVCLRTDLHRLFDAGLLTITQDYRVEIARALQGTSYAEMHGALVWTPARDAPDLYSLRIRGQFIA